MKLQDLRIFLVSSFLFGVLAFADVSVDAAVVKKLDIVLIYCPVIIQLLSRLGFNEIDYYRLCVFR